MGAYKIVVTDYYYPNLDAERAVFDGMGRPYELLDCTKLAPGGIKEPAALLPHVRDADALIVQFARITPEVIAAMERCKVIARYAIGVDIIDLPAARAKGIHVANVPDYCLDEVANTAAAHILNVARKISASRDLLLGGSFGMDAIRPMRRLKEATLTLLGFGNTARVLAEKMRPFFGRILAHDPYFTARADYPDVRFVDLDAALAEADVISVHLPLTGETRGLLGAEAFRKVKPGVVLVNTSRGGIVDEPALVDALGQGRVGWAGLDVLGDENFVASPLLRHPRVVLTPHIAWCSEEALGELQRKTAENVAAALVSGRPKYQVP